MKSVTREISRYFWMRVSKVVWWGIFVSRTVTWLWPQTWPLTSTPASAMAADLIWTLTPGRRILTTIENMAGIPVSVPDRVHNMSTRSSTWKPCTDRALFKKPSSINSVYRYPIGYKKCVLNRVLKTSTQSGTKNKYSIGSQYKFCEWESTEEEGFQSGLPS